MCEVHTSDNISGGHTGIAEVGPMLWRRVHGRSGGWADVVAEGAQA